ncbi:MAG: hypothetical protein NTX25_18560, partial [Proteobacteria bacterium]|nr:hypothetical protein [Pseudomonadota bacterium]
PIIVIGPSTMQDRFDDIPESIQITRVPRLPPDLADYLAKQAGTLKREHSGVTFIPKNHPLSFGYLSVPARLTRVHPDAAQLAISHPMGRFGICGLDSALFKKTLGRTVHFKVSNCHRHEQLGLQDFPYKIEGLLVDIRQKERHSLARYLIEYYSEKILDLDSHRQIDNKSNSQYIRPIEAIRSDSTPSTSVLAISPEAMVKTENPSTQNSSPKRTANILINPSREDVYPDNAIDRAVASWGRIGQEWKIFAFTLLFFGLLFSLIFLLRGPQEDLSGGLTEQLRIFKEMHQGSQTQPIQP